MAIGFAKYLVVAVATAVLSGCAAYRTDTSVTFESTTVQRRPDQIIISEDSLPGRKYRQVGQVEGEVSKLTIFHSDPTKEQVNAVLAEKALSLGADAVINVVYKSGVGLFTWGYMEGRGVAVKFAE